MEIVFTLMVLTTLAHAFVTHLLAHYCHEFLNPETRGKILLCSANYKRMLVTLGQNAGSTKSFPCGDNGECPNKCWWNSVNLLLLLYLSHIIHCACDSVITVFHASFSSTGDLTFSAVVETEHQLGMTYLYYTLICQSHLCS